MIKENYKLGKKPKLVDERTFKLSKYLIPENLPMPPRCVDWSPGTDRKWSMFLNDEIGCCAIVAIADLIEIWTGNASEEQRLSDADVLEAYQDVSGYTPGDPSTDVGCHMLEVLRYARNTGVGGHKILAFCEVDTSNALEVQTAMWLFGGLYTGVSLPNSIKSQKEGEPWDLYKPDGGVWGGHAIAEFASNTAEKICATWAEEQVITNDFATCYTDEQYAIISPDWIGKAGLSPSGFDMVQLNKDLSALTKH